MLKPGSPIMFNALAAPSQTAAFQGSVRLASTEANLPTKYSEAGSQKYCLWGCAIPTGVSSLIAFIEQRHAFQTGWLSTSRVVAVRDTKALLVPALERRGRYKNNVKLLGRFVPLKNVVRPDRMEGINGSPTRAART